MRKIHVHGSAESELIDVWRYSFEQSSEAQAGKCLDELNSGIRKLADQPEIEVRRDYKREGCLVLFVGSHAVYYTVTPVAVHIIRVLHRRMDPDRHLE